MLIRKTVLLALFTFFCSTPAAASSCSNNTPIQKTAAYYKDRAVFTARVVQLMGKIDNWDGKQYSEMVLAVVNRRFWGLPWYWPKVVILDGGYDSVMADGDEYLISGRRIRYGVLDVGGCSRTRMLKTAQVDLRTLDGSLCGGPGGTVLGTLYAYRPQQTLDLVFRPNETVTLTDSGGRRYSATTDAAGIFQFFHLRPGEYGIGTMLEGYRYTSDGKVQVTEGTCEDASLFFPPHMIAGHVSGLKQKSFWGWPEMAFVELVVSGDRNNGSEPLVAPTHVDGQFFFEKVPPGEYLLGVNLTRPPTAGNPFPPTYYPGTTDPRKAARITVNKEPIPGSLDFAIVGRVPLARVPIEVVLPDGTPVPRWAAELDLAWPTKGNWALIDQITGPDPRTLVGVAGRRHRVRAQDGVKYDAEAGTERCSDPVEVDAKPGAKPMRIVLTHPCNGNR